MLRLFYVVFVVMFVNSYLLALNVSTYKLSTSTSTSYPDLSLSNTTILTSISNQSNSLLSDTINLPFQFNYGGEMYSSLKISNKGYLTFNTVINTAYNNNSIDNAMLTKPLIMPLWDDLGSSNSIRYTVDGQGVNRVFKIEWKETKWSNNESNAAGTISFQVWLYEIDNSIEFYYKKENNPTGVASTRTATIGLYDAHSTMSTLQTITSTTTRVSHTQYVSTISDLPTLVIRHRFTPPTESELLDRWYVHVYDNGSSGVADVDNMNKYVGYYSFTTSIYKNLNDPELGEGFNSKRTSSQIGYIGWDGNSNPTNIPNNISNTYAKVEKYTGTSTLNANSGNDRFKYHFRRYRVPCGFYDVTMKLLDDRAVMSINGIKRWDSDPASTGTVPYGNSACGNGQCTARIGYIYLDNETNFELRVQENTGFTGAWMIVKKLTDFDLEDITLNNHQQELCLGQPAKIMSVNQVGTPTFSGVQLLNAQDVNWVYQWQESNPSTNNWTNISGATGKELNLGTTNYSKNYRVNITACGIMTPKSSITATIKYPNSPTTLSNNNSEKTCLVNTNQWIHFTEDINQGNSRLLASIHSQGQNLGDVKITSFIKPQPMTVPACDDLSNPFYFTEVLQRSWVIKPTYQPTSPILVKLPFTNNELNTLINSSNNNISPFDNVNSLADIKLSKYNSLNEDDNPLNNCPPVGIGGSILIYSSIDSGPISDYDSIIINQISENSHFKTFVLPSFSEIYLHGEFNNFPLSAKISNIYAHCDAQNGDNIINWTTISETETWKFVIEKSRDAINWSFVDEMDAAENSITEINYQIIDNNSTRGISYYRIVQYDLDGEKEVYGPISIDCNREKNELTIYPNPSQGIFNLDIYAVEDFGDTEILITDISGKKVHQEKISILKGNTIYDFTMLQLITGCYVINIQEENNAFRPVKVFLQ